MEGELQEAFRRRKQEEPVGEIVKKAGSNEPALCGIFALWKRLVSMMLEASVPIMLKRLVLMLEASGLSV